MRLSSLIITGFLALTSFASAQIAIEPITPNFRKQVPQQAQPQQAQPRPVGAPPVFNAPRVMPAPQAAPAYQQRPQHHPRPQHQPRPHIGGGGGFFPVPVPVPQYIDRPVYQQPYYVEEPRYYQQPQRYYNDEPTYRPRRARNVCRTIVARDRWGGRHYVKKCRPARRYR